MLIAKDMICPRSDRRLAVTFRHSHSKGERQMNQTRQRRAFTVVEIVIVIAVIAILATMLVPALEGVTQKPDYTREIRAAKNAYSNYVIQSNGHTVTFAVYRADDCFVAIRNGAVVGVYETADEALGALGLDPGMTPSDTVGDRLFLYGGNTSTDPVSPPTSDLSSSTTPPSPENPPQITEEVRYEVFSHLTQVCLIGDASAISGKPYTATLTPDNGYSLLTVTVSMGDEDITDSAYLDGTLHIPSVTGDITVTACATWSFPVWTVGAIDVEHGGNTADGTYPNRIRTDHIPVTEQMTVSVPDGDAEFCVFYYDVDKSFCGWSNIWLTDPLAVNASRCAYIRVMARDKQNPEHSLTVESGDRIHIRYGEYTPIWRLGSLDLDGLDVALSNRITSDYIPVSDTLTVSVLGGNADFCIFYYNEAKVFQSWSLDWTTSSLTVATSEFPYIRILVRNRENMTANLSVEFGENISVTFG